MRILSKTKIIDYIREEPAAEEALLIWYAKMDKGDFSPNELQHVFGYVDGVGDDLFIFNIKGNHYRLICRIFFKIKMVYIRFVGTHKEYDKINLDSL